MTRFHEHHKTRGINFWGAVAIGVGGMVGGGIFAVLGLAATLAGGATPVAFLVAGVVALLTAYSYAKLTTAYPSDGGTIVFIDRAFGVDLWTGGINNLLWLSYIVTLSLYAVAFANYTGTFFSDQHGTILHHTLVSTGILLPMILNLTSPALVSKTEAAVVLIKIGILLAVIAFGVGSIDASRLAPSGWEGPLAIIGGGMLIFVAYEGFELIANTAPNVSNPEKALPRAYYFSVGFVLVLYVVIAVVTVGSLSASEIQLASDFALAEATRPTLGQLGFTLVAVSAVLATFSAINATLYGSARLASSIASEGEAPTFLERRIWNRPVPGLVLTALFSLLLGNLADLTAISSMGSAGFLVIFAFVNAANFARYKETKSNRMIAALGVVACVGAVAALVVHTYQSEPQQLWVLVGLVGVGFAVEAIYLAFERRSFV
jgi:amino acid transporter